MLLGNYKQNPLLFVFMTRRRTIDYEAVFTYIKHSIFNNIDPAVGAIVYDFEFALWKAISNITAWHRL